MSSGEEEMQEERGRGTCEEFPSFFLEIKLPDARSAIIRPSYHGQKGKSLNELSKRMKEEKM